MHFLSYWVSAEYSREILGKMFFKHDVAEIDQHMTHQTCATARRLGISVQFGNGIQT